jgi:sortase A
MRKLRNVLFGILFLIGFGVLSYPTVSNQWNTYRQSKLISTYEDTVSTLTEEDFSGEWEAARAFNAAITQNNIYADVFGADSDDAAKSDYRKVLNAAGNDVMGYISIPKIDLELAIYHGTSESVLQNGVGHLNGTSLPIGGNGTHAVLAAHRGLPSAKLFTDLDELENGDVFYIHVLDETLAYQVDRILPMVDKDDSETLESALAIEDGKDYVTLFTCTPYGVNTHRLLVRGTRIPYDGSDVETTTVVGSMVKAVTNYYMLFMIMGIAVTILIILLLRFLFRRKQPESGRRTL